MMRVVIISDSHGHMENVERIMKKSGRVDMVIHLGDILGQDHILRSLCDCPVKIVRGNCDFYSENKYVDVFSIGENKIYATHGHLQGVDYGLLNLKLAAEEQGCNIALYGHTHVPDNMNYGHIIMVNPGSVSRPRQPNRKPTYALMKIDDAGKVDIRIEYV